MSLPVTLELQLMERKADRVYVSVVLEPTEASPTPTALLDGVALELYARSGESLGPRLLLPIAGALVSKMISTVELRAASAQLPAGARVIATAWSGTDQLEATCPCDPWTELEGHVRGTRTVVLRSEAVLEPLFHEEREHLVACFPWIDAPRPPRPGDNVLEDQGSATDIDDLCDDLGLDEEDAEFLKSLLQDDEE